MKDTLSLIFFLKNKFKKEGKSQINLRIIVDRAKAEVSTKFYALLGE